MEGASEVVGEEEEVEEEGEGSNTEVSSAEGCYGTKNTVACSNLHFSHC